MDRNGYTNIYRSEMVFKKRRSKAGHQSRWARDGSCTKNLGVLHFKEHCWKAAAGSWSSFPPNKTNTFYFVNDIFGTGFFCESHYWDGFLV